MATQWYGVVHVLVMLPNMFALLLMLIMTVWQGGIIVKVMLHYYN